jgi:hypothetical protein
MVCAMALAPILGVMLGTSVAFADDFFSSSPGPLAKEHAELDNQANCNSCHVNDSKAIDQNKCLDCHDHKDLRARIRANKGYHSSSKIKGKPCEDCHLDHKGRGFDIMGWRTVRGGEKGFDHKETGWPLQDKHKVLECKDCHKNKNKAGRRLYLGEDKNCGTCHKRDQPHGFDRKSLLQCERCHNEVAWKPAKDRLKFDHNKKSDAEFPQEGVHKEVSCGKCHPKSQFNLKRPKPGNCGNSGCHRSPHKDMLFDKKSCDWCHSPKNRSLKVFTFDHRARTRFNLSRSHSKLDCYQCHTKKLGAKRPERSCAKCHQDDNPHRDRFKQFGNPPACETCHPDSSFKKRRFDHTAKTNFPLWGKHDTDCRKCHLGNKPHDFLNVSRSTRRGNACMGCHEHKNVHNGKFTDKPKNQRPIINGKPQQTCVECHDPGDKAMCNPKKEKCNLPAAHRKRGSFPLVMQHKGVSCEKCHVDDEFEDIPKQCGVRCHDDSLHLGRLGDECATPTASLPIHPRTVRRLAVTPRTMPTVGAWGINASVVTWRPARILSITTRRVTTN